MEPEKKNERKRSEDRKHGRRFEKPAPDPIVEHAIQNAENNLSNSLTPVVLRSLNGFQQKQVDRYFSRNQEYRVKSIRENENASALQIYPIGNLIRFAETKAQEVLITGEPQVLPPMGAFERFTIHEYIQKRGGLRTESHGEYKQRHVEIFPVFGRTPRKAKRRLTR